MRGQLKEWIYLFIIPFLLSACTRSQVELTGELTPGLNLALSRESETDEMSGQINSIYSAQPLLNLYGTRTINEILNQANPATKNQYSREFIGYAIVDSMNKGHNFIVSMTGHQATQNTAFSIISLVLSGVASAFVPLSTVRALAATSAAVQGTRAAINSEFYQQMTSAIFVQQIEATYFRELEKYVSALSPQGDINVQVEMIRIRGIHRQCSIMNAASRLTAQVSEPVPPILNASLMFDGAIFKTRDGRFFIIRPSGRDRFTYQQANQNGQVSTETPPPISAALPAAQIAEIMTHLQARLQ